MGRDRRDVFNGGLEMISLASMAVACTEYSFEISFGERLLE